MQKQAQWLRWLQGAMLLTVGSCVDPYRPPEIASPNTFLVVEGNLNGGTGSSTIKLSRTQNLANANKPSPEQKATIRLEGTPYSFVETTTKGTYTLASATLPVGSKYQVRIKTGDGKEYLSDPITMKQTPKIDSLTAEVVGNGLQIYVNTHDASNKTRYYRWEYEDTYEFYTPFESPLEYVNKELIQRTGPPINHCWRTETSSTTLLGSSARLTQDILQKAPLLYLSATSPKLNVNYSILVSQYAQSAEGYAYWENLLKTTEQLGGLFDPLPSQVGGNLHCVTNPTEPVLGFLDGYTTEQLRVFIKRPPALSRNQIRTGYEGCFTDTIPKEKQPLDVFLRPGGGYNVIRPVEGSSTSYVATGVACTDCRDRGTIVKPSYWP
ncbi:DUF4249 domain-containing protein [Fibrella aquatilis]|uniref:DUF4249 domain-containing protein n=1 Tax=Fibrella aquatilis TaxID=2817059 RepID=A0A939GE17_9BACT|nr:DUF4249 domain-containing protein [Fibrella aquatilis]MBO0934847.1 DUF4249 domain-containing protein [Fibrella aquatilis]